MARESDVVWRRLKRLWRGPELSLDELEDATGGDAEEALATAPPPPPPDPVRDAIAQVERALTSQAEAEAIGRTRALLLEAAADLRVLRCASEVLGALGEEGLGEAFGAAADDPSDAAPLVWLSQAFLDLDDAELALVLGRAASERDRAAPPSAAAIANAQAALGRHADVVVELERFAPQWREPALLRRYIASAALIGDWARWDAAAAKLGDDPDSDWVRRQGERARAFPLGDGDPPARHELFVRYGATLIDTTEGVSLAQVPRLGAWIVSAASLLSPHRSDDLRVAYVGPRSEVVARWLGSALGVPAIPLSARLLDQPVVIALADDGDLDALYETESFFRAPSVLFQAVKDPSRPGTPVPEIIGMIGQGIALPLEALEGDKAADRTPPKLLASRLEAEAGSAKATPPIRSWANARERHLSLERPLLPEERALFG